jgi:hypothetical protein
MCPESGTRTVLFDRLAKRKPCASSSGATFRARRLGTADPGLKPWAESCCSFGAEERALEIDPGSASMAICVDIHRFQTPSFFT